MGKDNQPKHRQAARDLRRRAAVRPPYERILIVCEGEKTEPQYLNDIRNELRLSTANVQVCQGAIGTEPLQIATYAKDLFSNGDLGLGIEARAFDRVVVVFDRDQHQTYHAALSKAAALNGKLTNDEHKKIPFDAVASVPCFELWLLLHFENIQAPIHRSDVYQSLRRHLPGYAKGAGGHWLDTKASVVVATDRAKARASETNAYNGCEPYTDMHTLVHRLLHLKD